MRDIYRHYKGGLYRFLGYATLEATLEQMVVYEALEGANKGEVWIRPTKDWQATVMLNGTEVPRFEPVADSDDMPELM